MGSGWRGWRAWLAAHLPWYDAARERQRDAKTDRTVRRTEIARERGERIIAEYRAAVKVAGEATDLAVDAGERVVEEARRDDAK